MKRCIGLAAVCVALTSGLAQAGTTSFTVEALINPFRFRVDGVIRPVLTLERGTTYTFNATQDCLHPLLLTLSGTGGFGTVPYTVGVTNSGACGGVAMTFTPSAATPDTISYVCGNHTLMGNTINIVNAPPPACSGDANGDGITNAADLSVLLSQFGSSVPVGTGADLNDDAQVNAADLSVLLSDFGCD